MKKELNIYKIATEAGVSPATVSRVLTNNARVSEEKRKKVEEVIRKYDYRPNALARGLTNTKTKLIGILASENTISEVVIGKCNSDTRQWTVIKYDEENNRRKTHQQ